MKTSRPITPYAFSVYEWVQKIPRGKVTTYGALARQMGEGSARSAGQALKRNPFAPEVPCHRVIAGNRTLGGFNGQREGKELLRKRRLLESEGVVFEGKTVAKDCVI